MIKVIHAEANTTHPPGFEYEHSGTQGWWLFIQTHCKTFFEIDGKRIILPADAAIILSPNTRCRYGAAGTEPYSDDWIRFNADETFITGSSVPVDMPFNTRESQKLCILFPAKIFLTINIRKYHSNICLRFFCSNLTNQCRLHRITCLTYLCSSLE